jgi:hypothetical protein
MLLAKFILSPVMLISNFLDRFGISAGLIPTFKIPTLEEVVTPVK